MEREDYTVLYHKRERPNTTYLQGMGWIEGTPAGELKVGDTMLWNGGFSSKVDSIKKQTEKTIIIMEKAEYSVLGKGHEVIIRERKMLKARIVARPANELKR